MSNQDNISINWDDDASDDVSQDTNADFEFQQEDTFSNDDWDVKLPTEVEFDVPSDGPAEVVADVTSAPSGELVQVIQVDEDGTESVREVHLSNEPLTADEAKEITARIRSTTSALYLLIKRAHAGKAWNALGYNTFEQYVNEEFNYSRSYAYKLLNQANVIEAIEQAAPPGTQIHVGELTARGLKKDLPDILDEVEERTEGLDPDEASDVIQDIIQEAKDRRQEDRDMEVEDFDSFDGDAPAPSSNAFDYIDAEEDAEELDVFLKDDDVQTSMEHLEDLWLLLNRLDELGRLFQKDNLPDLFRLLPAHKREAFTAQVESHSEAFDRLKTLWDEFLTENPVSNDVPLEEEDGYSYE